MSHYTFKYILIACLLSFNAYGETSSWRYEAAGDEGVEQYSIEDESWRYSDDQSAGGDIYLNATDTQTEWTYEETPEVEVDDKTLQVRFVDPMPVGISVPKKKHVVKKGMRIPELKDFNLPSFDFEIGHFYSVIEGLDKFNGSTSTILSESNVHLQLGGSYRFHYNFSTSFFWKWNYYKYAHGTGTKRINNQEMFTSEAGVSVQLLIYEWLTFKVLASYSEDLHYRKREEGDIRLERVKTPKIEFTPIVDLHKSPKVTWQFYYTKAIHGEGDQDFYSARGEDADEVGLVFKHITKSGHLGVRGYFRVNYFTNDFFHLNEKDLGLTFFQKIGF